MLLGRIRSDDVSPPYEWQGAAGPAGWREADAERLRVELECGPLHTEAGDGTRRATNASLGRVQAPVEHARGVLKAWNEQCGVSRNLDDRILKSLLTHEQGIRPHEARSLSYHRGRKSGSQPNHLLGIYQQLHPNEQ
jgi:hypothetical protein